YRCVFCLPMVSGALAPVELEVCVVYAVDMLFMWFERFLIELVTCEAHPYSFQVRENRRLLALHLVQSRIVAELGLHHQQCNFLYLYTSGLATRASGYSYPLEAQNSGRSSAESSNSGEDCVGKAVRRTRDRKCLEDEEVAGSRAFSQIFSRAEVSGQYQRSRSRYVQAQSTRWFTVCERDPARHCILNVMALSDAFWLPLFAVFIWMSAACRAPGGLADIDSWKATTSCVVFMSR
ncbi:hypothetical protein Taro_029958, partial [Colocasia esculenta]|nr:hypothetical protein [Colocasia esculenta]